MKRTIFILIAAALIIWFWPSQKDQPIQLEPYVEEEIQKLELDEEVIAATPAKQNLEKGLKPTPILSQKQIAQRGTTPRNLAPGIVEFELLKDNWAVSHGDILLGKLQSKIEGSRGQFKPKKALLWDSNIIPYAFSKELTDPSEVLKAIEEINMNTKIQLVPVTAEDQNFIVFSPFEQRCASYLGKIGGPQPVFISKECGKQEILHEIMHALGFVHEQSRKDRDQYVKINWENIEQGFENQFDIAPDAYLEPYRGFVFAFDYQSVMLYSSLHFSKDKRLMTIESKTNKAIAPSQNGLSAVDIQRIDYLYGN